ncbi:aldo/keto reductase [Haladaptatus pallidirubidus]|uniref:Aldo/keto reductase n=1 Tax=Haladaptatus pallidirubidus TaxID=1008152 RepID=A0AAV3UPJ2_9EURY|nr:aldo/keto reductase [Haladaptatus pallidirubidus]
MADMEYTYLGETGLEVSKLCLGCMNFGSGWRPTYQDDWTVGEEDGVEVIDHAIENGINFLDTANTYSTGGSERIVGKAIQEYDRNEVVVATKVRNEMRQGPNGEGLSRKHILDQADASLERLDTDYIDLYQIHRWDDNTPIEETLSALDHLVNEGKVRYIGASTMPAWKFMKALYTSDVENLDRFISMQPEYSLVRRHEEENVLPLCDEEDIGVIPWSPLYGGFLTGKYEREEESPDGSRLGESGRSPDEVYSDEEWQVLDVVRELAKERGVSPTQVSLAWLLHNEIVTAPIIGPKTTEQLDENIRALGVALTDEEIERLEAPIDPVWTASQ